MHLAFLALVWLAWAVVADAKDKPRDSTIVNCEVVAFQEYSAANLALLQASIPLTVEGVLAQRRLEERYCIKVAQCDLAANSPQSPLFPIVFGSVVSGCLNDIAKDRSNLSK